VLSSTKIKEPNAVKYNQKKLKKWAKDSPLTYLHKFQLVKAEIFRNKGDFAKAEEMYLECNANANDRNLIDGESLVTCFRFFNYGFNSKEILR